MDKPDEQCKGQWQARFRVVQYLNQPGQFAPGLKLKAQVDMPVSLRLLEVLPKLEPGSGLGFPHFDFSRGLPSFSLEHRMKILARY